MDSTKSPLIIVLIVSLVLNAQAQTNLFFEDPVLSSEPVIQYIFNTGHVIHFDAPKSTGGPNYTCNGRENWFRLNNFILDLKSTSVDSLIIYGTSGWTYACSVSKVEVAAQIDGVFEDITQYVVVESDINDLCCGSIRVSGINVSRGNFLKITFSGQEHDVRVSEIEFFSKSQPSGVTAGITAESRKVSVLKEYFSLIGIGVPESTQGILIEKITYEDGSISILKRMNEQD